MIGICDVEIQAANPTMPLYPLRAYLNSPSSLRVRNVPKKVGDWRITNVQITVAYPDNTIKTAECKLIGNVWVGTVAGSSVSGTSENGYTVYASGIDENGDEVQDYVLGKGLVEILTTDGTITPGQDTHYLHLLGSQPSAPKEGDVYKKADGTYMLYQNNAWHPLGTNLDEAQLAAIDSVVDERATVVRNRDGTTTTSNIIGVFQQSDLGGRSPVDAKLGSTVTGIEYSAFYGCDSLVNVAMPESVTSIGALAFGMCTYLGSINIGKGVTEIGEEAFSGCGMLRSVTIPDSVTHIGSYAFFSCGWMTTITIGNGVTSIGDGAFHDCISLSSVTIPPSVTSIGSSAFYGCTNLTLRFEERTLAEVQAMTNYPWGLNTSKITAYKTATQNWVESKNYLTSVPNTYKTYTSTVESLSSDGYATQSWVGSQNYLTAIPNTYKTYTATVNSLSSDGYATQSWVNVQLGDIETILNNL